MADPASWVCEETPVREVLYLADMQTAPHPPQMVFLPKQSAAKTAGPFADSTDCKMSSYVVDEINAYVVIRDLALAEAERSITEVNLERARIANDFVENCLRSSRAPYNGQHLPEADAVRERSRCQAVKVRVALLRAHLVAKSREHACAA